MASRPPYNAPGSRLPCSATLSPTSARTSTGSAHQSSPNTSKHSESASRFNVCGALAPFAKSVIGTEGMLDEVRRALTERAMCWREGSEKVAKSYGESSPAHESNIWRS